MIRSSGTCRARGFTLIELMISVAIVGLLSSVAIPEFMNAQFRSRATERPLIMSGVAHAVGDIVQAQQLIPTGFSGAWNPNTVPPGGKGIINWTVSGWNQLPMVVQGATYYQYQFTLNALATPPLLTVQGRGDIDADGDSSTRVLTSHFQGYSLVQLTGDGDSFLGPSAENY